MNYEQLWREFRKQEVRRLRALGPDGRKAESRARIDALNWLCKTWGTLPPLSNALDAQWTRDDYAARSNAALRMFDNAFDAVPDPTAHDHEPPTRD